MDIEKIQWVVAWSYIKGCGENICGNLVYCVWNFVKGIDMEDFGSVTSIIKGVFPHIPDVRIARLARLIVSSCDDYNEALEVARKIPRQRYGTFRFNVVDKQWIVFYNSYGGEVDH